MKKVWAILLIVLSLPLYLTAQPLGGAAEQLFQRSLKVQIPGDTLLAYGMALASGPVGSIEENIYARLLMADGYLGARQLQLAEPILKDCYKMVDRTQPGLLAYIYYDFGELYRYNNNMEKSLQHLDSAYTYATQARDTLNISRTLGRLSVVYRKMGETEKALEKAIRCLQNANSTREPLLIAQANLTLGNMYFMELKDLETAMEFYNTALTICERQGFHKKAIALLYNMGMVALELESYEDSKTFFQSSAMYAIEEGMYKKQAHAHRGLGLLYKRQGAFDNALKEYHQALSIYAEMSNAGDQAVINNYLASVHLSKGEMDSTKHYAEISTRFAKKVGDLRTLRDAYHNLSNAALASGKVELAFEHYRSAQLYEDTLIDRQHNEKMLEMATRYETSKTERDLDLTKAELEKQMVIHEQRAFERNIMVATSAVLLLFISIYYNIQKKKKRLSAELSKAQIDDILKEQELKLLEASVEGQEQERQRIALDLHDRIGSLLSTVRMKMSAITKEENDPKDMTKALALLDRSVSEVRRISQDLASGTLVKFGLQGAVRDLISSFEFADGIRFTVNFHGLEARLPSEVERTIFRVVQESVSNALKHSKCNKIDIQVNRTDGMVNVMVEDNGRGFDPRKVQKGMGLKGMKARVGKYNGSFHIDSAIGRGSIINIDIPVGHIA